MSSAGRLRRLVPDDRLLQRRAAGEPLRSLAASYAVAHTTLGRYFARKEVVRQLRDTRRAQDQAASARQKAERRVERDVRKRAKENAALARSFSGKDAVRSQTPEHDIRGPWLREELLSKSDDLAADAVNIGGGIGAVIEATDLRTLDNVARRIDPAILVGAFDNDAAARALTRRDHARLRRLSPNAALLQRRAAGERLRRLAADYGVSHTTLSRWFARPTVARQLHELQRRPPPGAQERRRSRR